MVGISVWTQIMGSHRRRNILPHLICNTYVYASPSTAAPAPAAAAAWKEGAFLIAAASPARWGDYREREGSFGPASILHMIHTRDRGKRLEICVAKPEGQASGGCKRNETRVSHAGCVLNQRMPRAALINYVI